MVLKKIITIIFYNSAFLFIHLVDTFFNATCSAFGHFITICSHGIKSHWIPKWITSIFLSLPFFSSFLNSGKSGCNILFVMSELSTAIREWGLASAYFEKTHHFLLSPDIYIYVWALKICFCGVCSLIPSSWHISHIYLELQICNVNSKRKTSSKRKWKLWVIGCMATAQ